MASQHHGITAASTLLPPFPRRCYEALGLGMVRLGRAADAVSYLQQALDIRGTLLEAGHPLIIATLGHLGEVRRRQGRLEESEGLHSQALELRRAAAGPAAPGGGAGGGAGCARCVNVCLH